jgi:hypothetical protein
MEKTLLQRHFVPIQFPVWSAARHGVISGNNIQLQTDVGYVGSMECANYSTQTERAAILPSFSLRAIDTRFLEPDCFCGCNSGGAPEGRVPWIQVSHGVMPVFVDCRMQLVSQFASSHHSVQRVTAPVRMEQAQSEAGMCGSHARSWPPHCTAPFEFILVECTGWHRHDHWKHATSPCQ